VPQLDNLGLKENPFKNSTDHRYYYADQNRAQMLESTEHLIEYSDNLQVIIGSEGMGKTHMLDTLAQRLDKKWRIAKVSVDDQLDTLNFIQAILSAFGVEQEDGVDLLEALEGQLADIMELGLSAALFVDDAHNLSAEAVRFLIQLSQQKQDSEPYIKVVLFSTLDITEHLQSPELKQYREIIHIATLNNLDKEGVSGYLRHKLAVAGFDRESPFKPRIVDSIFKDSHGIPAQINFFAHKFLLSSGKGDDYITENEPQAARASEKDNPDANDFLSQLDDTDLEDDKIDLAEDQINRLTEKFEEIEKIDGGNHQVDDFFIEKDFMEKETVADDYEAPGLPRFVIPVAVIGVVLVALLVINIVFEDTHEQSEQQVSTEALELLPLELPEEKSLKQDTRQPQATETASLAGPEQAEEALSIVTPEVQKLQPVSVVTESRSEGLSQEIAAESNTVNETTTNVIIDEALTYQESKPPQTEQTQTAEIVSVEETSRGMEEPGFTARITSVDPEPVIGSRKRQAITIVGKDFDKSMSLIVLWGGNQKEFSEQKTPSQWQYVNNGKIKLFLTTGIEEQKWQVFAQAGAEKKSNAVSFQVVKPFMEKMAISELQPSPVIGSDKRQIITIMGKGFNKETVIELKWDKNSKHFSSRLSPNQFQLIDSGKIQLSITTGTKPRKWKVIAKKPDTGLTSTSFFNVVQPQTAENNAIAELKDESWLMQQQDDRYTIQLFGSYQKKALNKIIKDYKLQGDLANFQSQRNDRQWFSMTYGNYPTRQDANAAMQKLPSGLTSTQPWIRSFANIKQQLGKKPEKESPALALNSGNKNEAWIWTQNPSDYTIQLLVLSSEQAIKDYSRKYRIESESVLYQMKRNGKVLYALIHGHYPDKQSADEAKLALTKKIPGSNPWVRSFADVHDQMSPQ
jgi:MSHA biogenesis protein MshM